MLVCPCNLPCIESTVHPTDCPPVLRCKTGTALTTKIFAILTHSLNNASCKRGGAAEGPRYLFCGGGRMFPPAWSLALTWLAYQEDWRTVGRTDCLSERWSVCSALCSALCAVQFAQSSSCKEITQSALCLAICPNRVAQSAFCKALCAKNFPQST